MARAPNRDVVLRRLYYNKDSTVFYGSVKTLTAAARTHGISPVHVKEWLRAQPAHALHHPPRKVPKRDKIRSDGPFTHCHADLIDFRNFGKENANRKYVLVLVDSFSTLIFARAQYSKRSAETTKSLLSILKAMAPYHMHNLTTDRGETRNLANQHPEKLKELVNLWEAQREEIRKQTGATLVEN